MNFFKKTFVLVLSLTTLFMYQPKIEAYWGRDLLTGAGIIAGACVIGAALHHACKPISDSEEISRAQIVCSDAQSKHMNISCQYTNELDLFEMTAYAHPSHALIELKINIQSRNPSYAFMNFKDDLDYNLSSLDSMINTLSYKKNHLTKRKFKLFENSNEFSSQTCSLYLQQYDELCNQINMLSSELFHLYSRLKKLSLFVESLGEYKEEQALYKIEKLEEKINGIEERIGYNQNYYYNPCCSPQPANGWSLSARLDYLNDRAEQLALIEEEGYQNNCSGPTDSQYDCNTCYNQDDDCCDCCQSDDSDSCYY